VLAETRALLDAGFREIVLSGINLRQFGPDLAAADLPPGWRGPADFWALLSWLDAELGPQWAGRARLRVSSVDPGQFMGHAAERALEALTAGTLFCPHLHLSIQSGSPAVLRRMGRAHYGPEDILAFVRALGARVPLLGLGADILTAFPGETEEHHAETVALARELPLTYAHVFPYSRRPGTPAARLDGQLPRQVKKQRSAELRELVAEKKRAFLARVAAEAATVRVALQCGGEDEADHADGSGTPRGVSEHYVACRFIAPPVGAANRALVAARPVRAGEGYLEVIPQDGPDAAPRTPPEAP
jgi:tRNA A37 methylthiotransferase MiaB